MEILFKKSLQFYDSKIMSISNYWMILENIERKSRFTKLIKDKIAIIEINQLLCPFSIILTAKISE
jgi:hypothetical protein